MYFSILNFVRSPSLEAAAAAAAAAACFLARSFVFAHFCPLWPVSGELKPREREREEFVALSFLQHEAGLECISAGPAWQAKRKRERILEYMLCCFRV